MRRLQDTKQFQFFEMQTIDCDKFFNYFRMTSVLFEELLTLFGLYKTRICRIQK